jgi:hypothetical protein
MLQAMRIILMVMLVVVIATMNRKAVPIRSVRW